MDEQAAAVLEYGGLTALLEGADLRYVRAGDEELVRRIFVTVRDAHWRTLEPRIEHVEVRRSHGEFDVQLQVRHVSGDLDFRWSGLIRGRGDSELEYTMDGRIAHACAYNRIGFCVLHPLRESIGRHYGGVGDAGAFTGAISALVAPQRFVGGRFVALCPPARSLWIDRPGGGRVSFEFEGDLFEMEDQRNWSDGSLKTYCTPLELGFPHQAAAEQRIHRELRVAVSGTRPKHRPARHPTSTEIVLGKVGDTRLPTLGVAWPAEVTSARGRVAELVRDLGLDHLRVEVDPGVPESITALNDAAGTSRTTGCPLELALYISADSRDLLAHMASRLTASPIARVLVFHRDGRYVESTETTPPGLVTLARETLGSSLAPGTPVGGGTDMSFCELNRTRPDADGLDVVSYALM
ncbi:MAG: hypothetical protein ACRDNK_16825, partial [Solirubrobacteraceae bacterium]